MRAKTSILMLILFSPMYALAQEVSSDAVKWYDLEAAVHLAEQNPKPMFIEFIAEWCGWCKKMDKTTFSDKKVSDYLEGNFYAVKVDFDSKSPVKYQGVTYTGKEFAKHFGITGLPTMIYISQDQKSSQTIVGYKTSKQLIRELKKIKGDIL